MPTRSPFEKSSSGCTIRTMCEFSSFMEQLDLRDPPLLNRPFTWTNERQNPNLCRLDRFLISSAWADNFPHFFQEALSRLTSNHRPIVLNTENHSCELKPFRFENMWPVHLDFKSNVDAWWKKCMTSGKMRSRFY